MILVAYTVHKCTLQILTDSVKSLPENIRILPIQYLNAFIPLLLYTANSIKVVICNSQLYNASAMFKFKTASCSMSLLGVAFITIIAACH